MLVIKRFVLNFWEDVKVPLIYLGGTTLGNWLSDILWNELGLTSWPFKVLLPPLVMAGILIYALGRRLRLHAKREPGNRRAIEEQSHCLVSQSAMFSLITAMYLWCGGGLAGSLSIERISALLLSLLPYLQGKLEASVVHYRLKSLYSTAYNVIADMYVGGNQHISQRAVDEVLRSAHREISEMNPEIRQRFVADVMRCWAEDHREYGYDIEIRQVSPGNTRILIQQPWKD